ncbi:hypothetical protein SAMN05421837_106561 [Amycolatopsis pretoriensis]|uniref:Uncharacterized protein n=1 Tax=Amycolatopsis pretoriensis TaxID=218821 RepID=A0A1H5R4N5_9PSEU|nr:hypothetical protein SAMN05421837_106561 [Amycolatopsis pretoriensis]
MIVGATIALFGQFMSRTVEYKREGRRLFVENCASLIALEEDFRNRVWEERKLGLSDSVAQWDLSGYRLVAAQVRLTSDDERLLRSLADLRVAGQELGKSWRMGSLDSDELEVAWKKHKSALENFVAAAKRASQ